MKTRIKVPVLVREDGSFFVWEMDTTGAGNRWVGHGDPDKFAERAASSLAGPPPFYRDLAGRASSELPEFVDQRHGTSRIIYMECEVETPAPILSTAVAVAPVVSDA